MMHPFMIYNIKKEGGVHAYVNKYFRWEQRARRRDWVGLTLHAVLLQYRYLSEAIFRKTFSLFLLSTPFLLPAQSI